MKSYIGTKTLNAKPMTRAEWCVFRGWDLPENENGSDEGYLVEYTNGGKPNHPDFNGYISWSPKYVFENAYVKYNGEGLEPHQQRVAAEKAQNDDRIEKLSKFIHASDIFKTLASDEQERLKKQLTIMENYSGILDERMLAFGA